MTTKNLCSVDLEEQYDNSATLLERIAGLFADHLLSDITIEVGGKQYAAHRLILCASSDVFKVMLMDPKWRSSQMSHIELKEEPQCEPVFGDFLAYLYTGRARLDYMRVLPLAALADKYNVKDLMGLCTSYMAQHIITAARHNQLVSWFSYALNCDSASVRTDFSNFIAWNFELVAQMEDYGNIELDVLVSFLRRSDLVVVSEYDLFRFVVRWLILQERWLLSSGAGDEETFGATVARVMSEIRFSMLTIRQLRVLMTHSLTLRFPSIFVDRITAALDFQARGHLNGYHHPYSKLIAPRIYTSETWSTSISIDNFSQRRPFGTHTLIFMTPASLSGAISDEMLEWTVDLYPKGVHFAKFLLITPLGTIEGPEYKIKTVRLSLTSSRFNENLTAVVSVLVSGKQDGVEHVRMVVQKEFTFTMEDRILNLNDLVPFTELNRAHGCTSPFLIGPRCDLLSLRIAITPLCVEP